MSSTIYFENIETYLFRLADLIEHSNSLNRNNRAVDAENLFCVLLNTAFGWNLINANEDKSNQNSFDLIDKKRKIFIQVTSNKNQITKFNTTIASFKKKKQNKEFNQLIILFISRKCSANILKKVKARNFQYEGYDIPKLLNEIYYKNKTAKKLKELNEILEAELSPVTTSKSNALKKPTPVSLPKQTSIKRISGLYINRKTLIENIFVFGQITNGLLVGGPGVGKSFTIQELQRLCSRKKLPCIIIRINELLEGSDEALKEALTINTNWINALKNAHSANAIGKAFLIFDAFDTAKDEKIKSAILKQIQKAITELSENWSILVSARTFDASKSIRLLELFPYININKSISCRNFEIPELSESELLLSLKSEPALLAIFHKSTPSLKLLLRVPYFLKLLEKIIGEQGKVDKNELSNIETEEQLLKAFWDKKVVVNTETDIFLQKLTSILAINENLSCRKEKIVNELNHKVYDELVSLGIIEESSATKQNISFTHNILLDYAISKYLILEDVQELIQYISFNPKMPFIFRQSFIYFYSRLWNINPDLFWKHYFETRSINKPLFRLFHQTIINFILGGFYTSVKQLNPIFSIDKAEERGTVIKKILEGVRFINKGTIRENDYDLLLEASKYLHDSFIWELGFLIDKGISQLSKQPKNKLLIKITKASHNYLKFILNQRKTSTSKWLIDTNGSMWGVQNVCKTFSINKTEARRLLRNVLLILKEEDFPIKFFYTLSDNILHLFKHDPEFAVLVYKTIYLRNEVSDKETYLGNSAVLSLRSNRKQDFHSIHYKLEKDFPEILELSAETSIRLGVEIVNRFSAEKKSTVYKIVPFSLIVNGVRGKIIPDFSFYESKQDDEDGPFSYAENIFKFLEKKISENNQTKTNRLINIIVSCSEAPKLWRRLLKLISAYPKQLRLIGYGLLQNEAIFICNETVYEAGELIKALWPLFSSSQKNQMEKTILALRLSSLVKEDSDLGIRRVCRLLSCIPTKELKFQKSGDILSEHGNYENRPLVSYSGLQSYHASLEEKIANMGVDSSNSFEMTAYNQIKKIEPFNSKYNNNNLDKPTKMEYEPVFPVVKELFEICKTQASFNKKLLFNCDYEVSRFAKLLARIGAKLNKATRNLIEEIAYYYIDNSEYKKIEYQKGDIKIRSGAYSPTPRTAATQIFVELLHSDKSGRLAPIVLSLIADNMQIVRFKALHAFTYYWHHRRDDFWKVIEERIQNERDGMCLHRIIGSICYDNIIEENQKQVEKIATLAISSLSDGEDDAIYELWQVYVALLLKLLITYDSKVAKDIIYSNLYTKVFVRTLLIEVMTVLDPHEKENNYVSNPTKYDNLIHIVHYIIKIRFENIQIKGLQSEKIREDFEIIDLCIQQIYFTVAHGKKTNRGKALDKQNKVAFYFKIKSLLRFIVDESIKIETGFMVAHTGYYFMQFLNEMLCCDSEFILSVSSDIVKCAAANNFTYDQSTMLEIVKLTEQVLADHKEILSDREHFNSLITILDQFANSGWQEALELTWRLKEIF